MPSRLFVVTRHHWLMALGLCVSMLMQTTMAQDGNSLSYLTSNEVWYPHKDFPKFVTPQWVGDEGVECVVTLAIDDMRDPAKYEAYLRPILQRLKQIDGRAPVSIMTCQVKPDDPQLQKWLEEGLSLECHTADHPCPILAEGNFAKSKGTFDKCVDLLGSIPNNSPVAFRTPCCDSLNTVSPRLFSEIFNKTTSNGKFLQLDSSVFTVYTPDDATIPRDQLIDADGRDKFRKYIPRKLARGNIVHDGFVNLIENYPYPYVIQKLCWEFPCMVPSDWSANHLQAPNNPDTVRDLKIALDITVQKQGVFNLVFHPHGWIKAEQVIELIDHAVAKHGKKVKFLTFAECIQRLNKHALKGTSLRGPTGEDQGIRLIDFNRDGYMDLVSTDAKSSWSRVWNPNESKWIEVELNYDDVYKGSSTPKELWVNGEFLIDEKDSPLLFDVRGTATWGWIDGRWSRRRSGKGGTSMKDVLYHYLDINGDGESDRLVGLQASSGLLSPNPINGMTLLFNLSQPVLRGQRVVAREKLQALYMPEIESLPSQSQISWMDVERKVGARLIDINQDGWLDLIISNPVEYGAWLLFPSQEQPEELFSVRRTQPRQGVVEMPPIVLADGSDNGFFVKDQQLCWINESTDGLPDLVTRISFDAVMGGSASDYIRKARPPLAAKLSMRTAPGYQVDFVAWEPMTMDPVAFDWGPDDKLWIAEMADYPNGIDGHGKPGGRIRYLQGLRESGRYADSRLFLEEIPFPNGVIAWKKGVLISAAPDIIYAEDTDGDGKADIKKVLFTGLAEGNQQHRANGFTRGLDNWLYLANGDSGGTVRAVAALNGSKPPDKTVDIRGRDIRIRPDTGEIEAVVGQTQFGRNRDDWGNWFGNNNSRPMWHYLLDDRYLQRNPNLVAPHLQKDVSITPGAARVFPSSHTMTRFNDFHTADRFTSACSAMVYRDDVLSRNLPGTDDGEVSQVFVCEPVHNLVHRELMQADGLSFTSHRLPSEEQSEFLTSTDNWFRPTQVKTGPDGAVYVADMYRLVIEHPQWIPIEWQRKLDVRAGADMGRIWRVSAVDHTPLQELSLDKKPTADLVALLSHPNGWRRDIAQQLLIDRSDASAIPLLVAQAKATPKLDDASLSKTEAKAKALGRLHSLCTLDGLMLHESLRDEASEGLHGALLVTLADAHPGVRRHAVRLCEHFPQPDEPLWQQVSRLIDDKDPQVRLQLAYTLGELKHPQAGTLLGRLAVEGVTPGADHSSSDVHFIAAVISSLNAENLEPILAEVIQRGPDQTELLQQLLAQAVAFNQQSALVTLLNRATEATESHFQRWQYCAVEQFLISLDRRFTPLEKWLKGLSPEARPVADRLSTLFHAARDLAANESASPEDRIAAVRVLGRSTESSDDLKLLVELITPRFPPELQSAALATLARVKSDDVPASLIANYRSLAPGLRTRACDILLSRDRWRDELLTSLEQKQLLASDLDATTRQRLLESNSAKTVERASKVLAIPVNSDRVKLVAEYLPTVRAGGDAVLGRQLFVKMCAQCHKLGDTGHAVGPDLLSLTDKSPDALIAAVLDPNRAVETKFLTFTAITKSGVTHTGLMAAETAGTITLRAAEAKETTLLRNELDELQSNAKSLMPEGLERDLKPVDAAALIAYIRLNVPLPAMKEFAGNKPRVVTADAQGAFTLMPYEAEIYGPTIVIEDQHKNLGWWSSADDIVVWTINVPQTGTYQVEWDYACDPTAAGNRIVVEAAGKSVTLKVAATGGWDQYQKQTMGLLELPAGEVRITAKPASRPLPALADVRSIVLRKQK